MCLFQIALILLIKEQRVLRIGASIGDIQVPYRMFAGDIMINTLSQHCTYWLMCLIGMDISDSSNVMCLYVV